MIMKKVPLPMVPFQSCQESLRRTRLGQRFTLHNSFVCAGGQENVDTCQVRINLSNKINHKIMFAIFFF